MAGEGRDGMEELIPENSTLARRIRAAASKGTLSHAAILSGSGDRMAAARYFAAALECEGEGERPCLRCRQCRKVLEDIHPRDSWRASKAFRSHIAVESAKRCLMESVKLAGGEL